jgi:adenosylcobinamide-GDP ribazoletransferase
MSCSPSVRGARAALVFLTRLPAGGFPYSHADLRWASAHFPMVGLLVGALGAAVLWAAQPLGSFLAATLSVTATVLATGALHEDGLADTADALGGSHEPTKVHAILKDSRVGAYGAIALVLSLLLRIGALSQLGPSGAPLLLLAHSVARTGPVWLMAALPYVTNEAAKVAAIAKGGGAAQASVASVWMLFACGIAVVAGVAPSVALASPPAMVLTTLLLGSWFRARIGGFTGDLLGATEQVNEVVLLLLGLTLLGSGW